MIPNTFSKDSVFLSLLFIFLLLPFAQTKVLFFGIPFYLPEIAICFAGFFFFCRFFTKKQMFSDIFFPDAIFLFGALLFFSGAVLSFLTNPFSLTGVGMLKSWLLFPIIAAFLVFLEAKNEAKRHWFLMAWLLTLVATAIGSLAFVILGSMTFDNRLSGLFSSPNFLALFLAPGVFIVILLFSFVNGIERRSVILKTLLAMSGLSLVVAIFYTRSYNVWIALFISLCFLFFFQKNLFFIRKKTILLAFGILVLVTSTFFILDADTDKWQSLISFEERSSLASRGMIWRSAAKIAEENWLLGIGVGRFQNVYLEYQRFFPPYLEWAVPEPHNLYLAVHLSTGTVGLFGFFILITRFFSLGWQSFCQSKEKEKRSLALIFISVMVFFLIYGLVDTPYFKNDLALSFWCLFALGLSLFSSRHTQK